MSDLKNLWLLAVPAFLAIWFLVPKKNSFIFSAVALKLFGILELLVSRGESKEQPLTLYKAKVDKQSKYLRIKPINKFGAPARGATVTLLTNQRKHSKTIDAGSGYLCQMEPVAHYGIRKNEKNFNVEVRWTDGSKEMIDIKRLNQTITVKQKWKKY